jgi:hypothetical protein
MFFMTHFVKGVYFFNAAIQMLTVHMKGKDPAKGFTLLLSLSQYSITYPPALIIEVPTKVKNIHLILFVLLKRTLLLLTYSERATRALLSDQLSFKNGKNPSKHHRFLHINH